MSSEIVPGTDAPPAEEQGQPSTEAETEQPEAQQTPSEDSPERLKVELEDVRTQLAAARQELKRVQGTSDKNAASLKKDITALEKSLTNLVSQLLTPEQAKVYEAERILARQNDQSAPAPDLSAEQARFSEWSKATLEREALKWSPDMQAKFEAYLATEEQTPAGWRAALGLTIADARKAEAIKAREDAKKQVEAERARGRSERRQNEPSVDRGGPAAPAQAHKPLRDMNEQEFAAHLEAKNREAASRRR